MREGRIHEERAEEMEIGATSGQTHADVLTSALGRERGLRVATEGGPGGPQARKK